MNTGLQRVWCRRIHDGRATIDDVTPAENQAYNCNLFVEAWDENRSGSNISWA